MLVVRKSPVEATGNAATRLSNLRFALAIVVATIVSVLLLQDNLELPKRFWHWVWPAGLVGLLAKTLELPFAGKKKSSARVLGWLVAGVVSAWMLTPTWSTLVPGQVSVGTALAIYLVVLAVAFEFASTLSVTNDSSNEVTRQLVVAISVACAFLAASIAASADLKYGELAAAVSMAIAGCVVAHGWQIGRDNALATLVPVAAFLVGCVAFVGVIYPAKPLLRLLPIPFAPLAVPLALRFFQSDSWRDIGLRYGVFLAVLVPLTLFAVL